MSELTCQSVLLSARRAMRREEEMELDATLISAQGSSRSQILLTHLGACRARSVSRDSGTYLLSSAVSHNLDSWLAAYTDHIRKKFDEDLSIFAQSTNPIPKRTNKFQRITEHHTADHQFSCRR